MRKYLFALLTSVPFLTGAAHSAEIFNDEFDGTSIDGKWTVLRPVPDNYAVENGQLLMISSKIGRLSDNTAENVLMPNAELPEGDWTMSIKFSAEFQTAREELVFGVMDSDAVHIEAIVGTGGDVYSLRRWYVFAGIRQKHNEDTHEFGRILADCANCGDNPNFAQFAANIAQPVEAKLEKLGHQFILSVKLGADTSQWTTLERITAINAKGKPVLFLRQSEQVSGETLVKIDSFRVESNE